MVPADVLIRFSNQIKRAARFAVQTFEPRVELEDAEQEAAILVVTYAGLMPGRHFCKLRQIEREAAGDEYRVLGIVDKQLQLDILELYGRQVQKSQTTASLENLPLNAQPSDAPEDRWAARIDENFYVRQEYPYLAVVALDQMTDECIATKTGESVRTVFYKLAAERVIAAADPYFIRMKS